MNFRTAFALTLGAVALLPLAAHAQSSFNLSGRVDLGLRHDSAIDAATGSKIGTRMASGTNSNIALTGTEELGGGMAAFFNIEHRFNASNGAVSDPSSFWNEISVVGLRGSMGSVQLGRQDGPIFYGLSPDAFYGDYVGGRGERKAGADDKFNNGVLYMSPTVNGVQLILGATVDKGAPIGGLQPDRARAGALRYSNGAFTASTALAKRFNGDTAYGVGGTYNFGVATLLFVAGRNDGEGIVGLSDGKRTTLDIGTIVPVSAQGSVRAKYNTDKRGASTTRNLGLGYLHDLSKRTNLYVTGSQTKVTGASATEAMDMGIVHRF